MKLFLKIIFKNFYKIIIDLNYRTFLKLVILYGDKQRYIKDKISFLNYNINIVDHLSVIWQFKEVFVDEIYNFNSEIMSPVIYDCGANVGISCLYFKKIYPNSKIKAFEADPELAQILNKNLTSNKINDVEIVNKAVWINNDGIELGLEGADGSSIFLKDNTVRVQSIRLKDLLESENKIDFLKLDIEGAEVDVLKDCKKNLYKVDNLFIEYHSFLSYHQELDVVLQILTENKFRYFLKQPVDRDSPFVKRINKNYPEMDLQLNIFAYKTNT